MTGLRKAALAAITVLVAAASLSSFTESCRALLDWASGHGLHAVWALAWPLQVDTFIAVGELALFVGLAVLLVRPVAGGSLDGDRARADRQRCRQHRPRRRA